jgi:hypothetical protein
MTLRKTYKNWDKAKKLAIELQPLVEEKFGEEKLHKGFVDSVIGFDSSLIEYTECRTEEDLVLEFE